MPVQNYQILLSTFIPFGPARTKLLIDYFGSAKRAWLASVSDLNEIGLPSQLVTKFIHHRKTLATINYFNRLEKLGITALTKDDKNYPANLAEIDDAPYTLYVLGSILKADRNAIAIVGSRKMTSYGREVATKFASELAAVGLTIISGLAFGIDVAAHSATLDVGGRAIAVLASGLDSITPVSNTWLASKIVKTGGAVVSEYPLGTPAFRTHFPARNRIISGLSRGVLVVEGARKSGTLLTAKSAGEQGKTVFAVPGPITSFNSEAPHFLIQNGAKLTATSQDVLTELDYDLQVDADAVEKVLPQDADELKLYSLLTAEPLHLDELARITELPVSKVSARLTVMEIKGLVKNVGSGVYKKT